MSERLLSRWMNYKHNHSQIHNSRTRDEDYVEEKAIPRISTVNRIAAQV